MRRFDYDLVTLGAGSGGVRATRLAGGFGARAAIVEKSRVGGTCVMRGCVPKKLLVYAADAAGDIADAEAYGWTVATPRFDWPTLIRNKNVELDRLEGVYESVLRNNRVELIRGTARLADARTVEVDGRTLTADKILIATGGWPSLPDIPGMAHVITSNEALDLPELPRRMVIVGGGYIAVEFAGVFNALGVEVSQIIRAGTVLRGFDDDVREVLAEEMEKHGIRILRDTIVRAIDRTADGFQVCLAGDEAIETDLVMYATGRAPNTGGLGLEEAGVRLDNRGAIVVDAGHRTSVDTIFAVGDCTDRLNLTPVAIAEGRCFAETHFNANPMVMDYTNVATAVFSHPPVGTVGLSEAAARARGAVDVYVSRFRPLKHTLTGRDTRMLIKVVVDRETDRVLGCHMVGADAPEIAQGLAIALKCGATKAQFDATVGIHPTAAEEFVTLRDKRPDHAVAAV
jgi:glutathione reductase (NADPH)